MNIYLPSFLFILYSAALAVTITVSPSDAFRDSLALLGAGDTLYMSPGTYSIPDSQPLLHIHTWQDGLVITGDRNNRPVLDGQDYPRSVVFLEGPLSGETIIENLSVTGGNASGSEYFAGGGILLQSAGCRIQYCSVIQCTALFGGGIYAEGGTPLLEWLDVSGNSASVSGGGISFYASQAALGHSRVAENTSADDGGGIYSSMGNMTLENVLLTGNVSGDDGGGIMQLQGLCDLSFLTIDHNICFDDGAGILASFVDSLAMQSCIVTSNQGTGGIAGKSGAEPCFFSHCCVWNNGTANYKNIPDPTGTLGNISEDPLYADTLNRLSQIEAGQPWESPAVNSGHCSAIGSPVEGLSTRTDSLPDSGFADMGFHYGPPDTSSAPGGGSTTYFDIALFPSPAMNSVTIAVSTGFLSQVDLAVFDVSGRKLADIGSFLISGEIEIPWDLPPGIPAGFIVIRMRTVEGCLSEKLVHLP